MARILVIDDETNIRMMIRLALQHVGHEVVTASDGPEGLEQYGDGAMWDLVLLDHRMPGMEGVDVLKEMRCRNADARVIMITAFGTIDLAVRAMKAGATDFLRKPFTAQTLRGAVASVLERGSEPGAIAEAASAVSFGMTTLNGFHISSRPGPNRDADGGYRYDYEVCSPDQQARACTVVLPVYVAELVKAYADREVLPGGSRFWQALCEEALANYLWQFAEQPPTGEVVVEDLSSGLKRWIDAVLAEAA